MIILMADHQTTGGYPIIGNVIKSDLPLIAQAGIGGNISFEKISIAEAEEINAQFQKDLSFLKLGVRLKNNADG